MKTLLVIGTGGFIGSVCRYLLSLFIHNKVVSAFPFGTLGVNIIGCFAIGLIYAFYDKGHLSTDWRLFLATGICGGFTTFSAFSNETITLMRNDQMVYAFTYVAASVIIGLLATFLAITIIKFV